MTKFKGGFGLQLVTPIATHYSIPEWVELAREVEVVKPLTMVRETA